MLVSDPAFVRCDLDRSLKAPISEDCAHPQEFTLSETGRCLQNSIEEASLSAWRVQYCRSCKAHILGFDHHCPAFGNCIGPKNHALFIGLLVGFIMTEALYALTAYQWTERNKIHKANSIKIAQSLAISTMIFSLVQVLWQINWRRYPEFHVIVQPNQSSSELRFRNPYHKGIVANLKDFLQRFR